MATIFPNSILYLLRCFTPQSHEPRQGEGRNQCVWKLPQQTQYFHKNTCLQKIKGSSIIRWHYSPYCALSFKNNNIHTIHFDKMVWPNLTINKLFRIFLIILLYLIFIVFKSFPQHSLMESFTTLQDKRKRFYYPCGLTDKEPDHHLELSDLLKLAQLIHSAVKIEP